MNYLEALQWRYSVKKFSGEMIDSQALKNILEAARLSVSSLGLQPYKLVVVENDAEKKKLIPAFYNPSQISTCSHLIAIVVKTKIDAHYVDAYFSHIAKERGIDAQELQAFRRSIDAFVTTYNTESLTNWAEKQAYIVLGSIIMAAAQEAVDTCPMEGFRHDVLAEMLDLDLTQEKIAVVVTLGKRAEDDDFQNFKKIRKPEDKFIKLI